MAEPAGVLAQDQWVRRRASKPTAAASPISQTMPSAPPPLAGGMATGSVPGATLPRANLRASPALASGAVLAIVAVSVAFALALFELASVTLSVTP